MKKMIFSFLLIACLLLAACTAKTYTVKFVIDGETVKEETAEKVTFPNDLEKVGYELDGWYLDNVKWDSDMKLNSDITLTATWKAVEYNISYDLDGGTLTSPKDKYTCEEDVILQIPEKIGYQFTGWKNEKGELVEKISKGTTGNISLTANWSLAEYTVKFYDADNKLLFEETVKVNQSATAPNAPTKEGYTFISWDQDLSNVTSDMHIKPIMELTQYTIQYEVNGGTLDNPVSSYTIENEVVLPIPTKEGYEFIGWTYVNMSSNKPIAIIEKGTTGDLILVAMWKAVEYTVRFYDNENNLLSEQKVKHDEAALEPDLPVIPGYEITGWNQDFSKVTSDMDIKPIVELKNYTIKYYDGDTELTGLMPNVYNVLDSDEVILPDAPVKQGYDFVGWFEGQIQSVSFLTTDAYDKAYTAIYKEQQQPLSFPTTYSFLFKNIKTTQASADPLTYAYQPDFSGLAVTNSATSWTWSSLDETIATISEFSSIRMVSHGYTIIKAVHKTYGDQIGYAVIKCDGSGVSISSLEEANAVQKTFKVTFADESGNVIDAQAVEKGHAAKLPNAPVKEGYTFTGWDKPHYNITADVTLKPTYKAGESDFAGKTVSILGDSMSTYNLIIPEGYSCFYPYATADVFDMNQTWWMRVINGLGMKLLMNNSYSGSCVSTGTGGSATTNVARLRELIGGNRKPDIIIIFMGANDCGSKYVSLDTFTSSYKMMLDMIQDLCPNSEIYLMNLPSCALYTDSERIKYNNVIKKYADEYQLTLLNISSVFTQSTYKSYVVDSVHPNNAGMEKIGNLVIRLLLNSKGIK